MSILKIKDENGNIIEVLALKGKDGYSPIKGKDYFDGEPGTSVTVQSVSESAVDGGSNVVTFSDGKTLTIKNGKTGANGKDGKTPVKGTDYFTQTEVQEIAQAASELVEIPDVVRYVKQTLTDAQKAQARENIGVPVANVAYATCSTEAATAEKAVAVSGNDLWDLKVGSVVMVYFDNSNSASNVKLNVNGTGAYPIWYNNAEYTSTGTQYCGYAMRVINYVFNGTHWVWIGSSYDANTTYKNAALGHGYVTCSTAAATAAKVGTLSSYALTLGGVVAVKFTNAVPANATLNINSKGAKNIFYRGAKITAGVIKAGDTATFIYDGTQYQLLSVDRWQNDIESLSSKEVVLFAEQTLTSEQKAQARANIGVSEMPEFVESIEECVDTTKKYVLPDGYIYEYRETTEIVRNTNHVLSSLESNGTPYNNGTGYKEGYRLNSSGIEAQKDGAVVSGFIPYNGEDIEFRIPNNGRANANNYLHLYNVNHVLIVPTGVDGSFRQVHMWVNTYGATVTFDDVALTQKIIIPKELVDSSTKYIRVSATTDVSLSDDTFNIALNESLDDSTTVTSYKWVKTENRFGINYDEEIAELDERVTALETNGGSGTGGNTPASEDIPTYVVEEAEATIAKVFSHGDLGRTIRFIAIADTHETSEGSPNTQITTSNMHAGQAIKYISDRIGLDFIAHLGDASGSGSWAVYSSVNSLITDIKNINDFIFSGVRGVRTVFIPGNHDQCSDSNLVRLNNSGAFPLFGAMCDGKKDRIKGCGYFDIEDANVRVIYLNMADVPANKVDTVATTYLGITQEQKNWLCEMLIDTNTKDNASEWGILFLSHAPMDFASNIAAEILTPYINGESYNGYTFTNNSVKIISNVHGHVHSYSYGYMENKIRRFAIPNACYLGNNHYGNKESYAPWVDTVTYNKTANSGKDTAFSLVTIDLDSGMCYVDNYGAGIDRVFSTNYASDIAVPQSISNISYDGITTVGEQIDNSLISYTVNYSDGTKSEKTGGVSINPATIIATGANTYTVTYTEGSNSVTGTLVITGTKTFYSVTNNLTNCTNSNTATRVDHGIAYSATITANEGYEISSITAKMGSTTLSVVDNTINIASVTNDIVITATATAVEVPEPAGRLLNLDRTYVTGTTGENLKDNLDASKAYLNVNRTATEVFHEKSCSVSNVTEDSVTVTESGIGGIVVAYPIYLPGISNSSYRVTFDYSGSGKCRSYYRYYTSAGVSSGNANLFIDDTTGGTGSADVTIPASTGFDWLVIYLTSNTGNTKTFSNVMLTKA